MGENIPEIDEILRSSMDTGWVLEPDAKRIFKLAGLDVPRSTVATNLDQALHFAHEIGYPVVAKIVSPTIVHKSDVKGVVVGIRDYDELVKTYQRLSRLEGCVGVLVEEMVKGIELIVGAKIDYQFGPMILLGMGGTGVEIYQDISLRMAPLTHKDGQTMVDGLKAHRLLKGYRGSEPVNLQMITDTLIAFSTLVMEYEHLVESIDLNPLMCSAQRCVIADARIILRHESP
ncbi:MAG: acetate--CoA ligase family protein [Desulfomonilia bacterium]|nr:acetate--CoA ligase family protein [Desulfomonilia bacterium]